MRNEKSSFSVYKTDKSISYLEKHTHFVLFDDGPNGMNDVLLKRQEIEHELSVSKILKSPIIDYQPQTASMY